MEQQQGWIKLYRGLLEWEWASSPNMLSVFIHCLLNASYQDSKYKGIVIKKGSFITSYPKLAKATGLSVMQVRTCLDKLQETKELTYEGNNQGSIITIVNFDKYQGCEEKQEEEKKERVVNYEESIHKVKELFLQSERFNLIATSRGKTSYELIKLFDDYINEELIRRKHSNNINLNSLYDSIVDHFFNWVKTVDKKQQPKPTIGFKPKSENEMRAERLLKRVQDGHTIS